MHHGEGIRAYYERKIEELSAQLREKQQNQQRLEAQRNKVNAQGIKF